MIFDNVLENIKRGREGLNEGIPMGFNRLSYHLPNIQKSRYDLIVGESGSGKSAFLDTAYVYNPIDWYIKNKEETNIKLKIFYYSFEINKERLLTKQIARKVFVDTGQILNVNYILSQGKNRISDEHFKLIYNCQDYFYKAEEYLEIKDVGGAQSYNPTGVRNDLLKWAEANGKFNQLPNNRVEYIENNPNLYTIVALDHMAIQPKERGFNTKENMDKMSEYTVFLRNQCKFSFAYLVQANRNLGDIDRLKMQGNNLAIRQGDIKDSSNPAQDSDNIIGILNPWKYEIPEYRKYDLTKLKGRQRFINLAKARDGEAEQSLGLLFVGECGYFRELPRADEINDDYYSRVERLGK